MRTPVDAGGNDAENPRGGNPEHVLYSVYSAAANTWTPGVFDTDYIEPLQKDCGKGLQVFFLPPFIPFRATPCRERGYPMHRIVMIRHGESVWNMENRFTGWTDVDLSERGIREARSAGLILKEKGFQFDVAFTSLLKRAIRTLWLVLDAMDLMWIEVHHTWRLNERHYGALQGLNKAEAAKTMGEEQVQWWRRSYDIPPPPLDRNDGRYPGKDRRYGNLAEKDIPLTESLKDTITRLLPCWETAIAPAVQAGRHVLIAAHGNSLRGLVKHLDGMSGEEVVKLEIPTGVPMVYELDDNLKKIRHYYLHQEEKEKTQS